VLVQRIFAIRIQNLAEVQVLDVDLLMGHAMLLGPSMPPVDASV
jgi:hypothetical protein